MFKTFQMFIATQKSCLLVFDYYKKIEGSATSQSLCYQMTTVYLLWVIAFGFIVVIRLLSLQYMFRSWKLLHRKGKDKVKRELAKIERRKKQKRILRRDIQRAITSKQSKIIAY